ncbi:hypothetical protein F5X99DRAFT_400597 [Biscogniauxia marginata]|nr:hypothetical protein F5X99DRAFT_400597 [Biscogniauxia marginata]
MSVDLLYPDNRNRGNRVKQLVTQISTIQNDARLNKSTVSDQLKVIESKFQDVLQAHGLQSIDELRKKLMESMPEDVKNKYLDLVKYYEDDVANDSQIIDVIGLVIMVAGGTALTAKMVEFVTSGKIVTAMNYIIRALIALTKDVEAAQQLIRLGSAIVKSLSTEIELGETAMKSLKFVKAAGTVITVLGVFIDAVILIIAAIKGAEQRQELEDAINDLAYRRVTAQGIALMGDVYAQYISSMYVMVVKMKRKSDIADVVDEACDDLKKGLKNVNLETVLDALKKLDDSDSTTWTDKDPSKEAIKRWWEDGNDPTKYHGPVPDKHLEDSK